MALRDGAAGPVDVDFLNESRMGAMMRSHCWQSSALGPPGTWPDALRAVVGLMLGSHFPMFVAWGDERALLYNDAYAELLGAKHPQALGARLDATWAEIWSEIAPLIDAALAGTATYRKNLPLTVNRRGFDEQAFFTFSYSPVRDNAGHVTGMFCVVNETTDQVKAERRITDERERQHRVFEQAPGFIAITTGSDHRFEFVNESCRRLTGPRAFLGRAARDVFPDLAGQPFFDLLDKTYASGERFIARSILIRLQVTPGAEPSERFLDFIYEPVRDATGAVTGLFVEGSDVTESHLSREALRASEGRFRALAHATTNIAFRMSADWSRMFRLEGAGLLVDTTATTTAWAETYIPADDRQRIRDAVAQAIATRGVYELQHKVRRQDGTTGWLFSRAVPVLDEAGQIVEWFGTASDVTDRVRVDESFSRLFDASPAPLLVVAPDAPRFTIRQVNDAYLAATLASRDALVGRGIFEFFPDSVDRVHTTDSTERADNPAGGSVAILKASLQRVLDTRAPDALSGFRFDIDRPDGSVEQRWWNPVNSPVLDENGNVEAIIHHANDVTDQRSSEAALRTSESRLKLALDAGRLAELTFMLPDGIVHSSAFAELLGYPPDRQVSFAEFRAHYHPDDLDRVLSERTAILDGGSIFYEVEKRIVRNDGVVRWLYGRGGVQRDAAGRPISVTAVYLDQTDRKLAENALRESEARLRAVVDAAPVGLIFADVTGRITSGNAQVEAIIGGPIIASKGVESYRDDYVAFHADGRQIEGDEYPLALVLNTEAERAEIEAHVVRPDGSRRWVRYIATPVRDESRKLLGAVVASVDIEQDKRFAENLAQEVARAIAELTTAQEALRHSQKMEAMGALTGGVAHDFNNLLTPIMGSLDSLQRRGVGDERAQRMIAIALQAAERAQMLVQRLLAFARRQPLQATSVDVRTLVEGITDLVTSTTGPLVKVRVDVEPDLMPIKADANQIEMALLNLVVNAGDAMPDGGTLTIGAAEEWARPGHRAGLAPGHFVRLSVEDTGFGMDAETLKRAVEPFYSTKGIGKGTGLGLSMAHGLAAQLGGGMHIESREGRGTRVELWLPIAEPSPSPSPSPVTPPVTLQVQSPRPAAAGTVLLVDDEDLVRESTAEMLADMGFHVVEATCPEAALRLIADGLLPDILVTDHLMPGMTGTELAGKLRALHPGVAGTRHFGIFGIRRSRCRRRTPCQTVSPRRPCRVRWRFVGEACLGSQRTLATPADRAPLQGPRTSAQVDRCPPVIRTGNEVRRWAGRKHSSDRGASALPWRHRLPRPGFGPLRLMSSTKSAARPMSTRH